jgi:hypothetical protein
LKLPGLVTVLVGSNPAPSALVQPAEHAGWRQLSRTGVVVRYLAAGENLAAGAGPAPPEEGRAALEDTAAGHNLVRAGAHRVKGGGPDEPGVPVLDRVLITMSPSRNGKPVHRALSSSADR